MENSVYFNIHAQTMKFSIKGSFNKCDQTAVSGGFDHIYWKNL